MSPVGLRWEVFVHMRRDALCGRKEMAPGIRIGAPCIPVRQQEGISDLRPTEGKREIVV